MIPRKPTPPLANTIQKYKKGSSINPQSSLPKKNPFNETNKPQSFKSLPMPISLKNNHNTQEQLQTSPMSTSRSLSQAIRSYKIESNKLSQYESVISDFFINSVPENIVMDMEGFISMQLDVNDVYIWEESPTLGVLYSANLNKIIFNDEGIVGAAFRSREIIKIPQADKNPSFSKTVDGSIIHPTSSLILFPLLTSHQTLFGIVEIVKRFTEPDVTRNDELFCQTFQNKFSIFSEWTIEPPLEEELITSLSKLMSTEQYILLYQKLMASYFDCVTAEIWYLKNETRKMVCFSSSIQEVKPHLWGIVYSAINLGSLINVQNVKRHSAYVAETDGKSDSPLLALPYKNSTTDDLYCFVLRGQQHKLIFTSYYEQLLSKIVPYLGTAFSNALVFSKFDVANNSNVQFIDTLINTLPKPDSPSTSNEFLIKLMTTLIKITNCERGTFYTINKEKRQLESLYQTGLYHSLIVPLGTGISGTSALTGKIINMVDAYLSPLFEKKYDEQYNFKTRELLTIPIFGAGGFVIAVIQLINRRDQCPFSNEDISAGITFGTLCAFLIDNSELYWKSEELNEKLSNITQRLIMMSKSSKLNEIISSIPKYLCELIGCDNASILTYDPSIQKMKTKYYAGKKISILCFDLQSKFFRKLMETPKQYNSTEDLSKAIASQNYPQIPHQKIIAESSPTFSLNPSPILNSSKTYFLNEDDIRNPLSHVVIVSNPMSDPCYQSESLEERKRCKNFAAIPVGLPNEGYIAILRVENKESGFSQFDQIALVCYANILTLAFEISRKDELIQHGKAKMRMMKFLSEEEYNTQTIPLRFKRPPGAEDPYFLTFDTTQYKGSGLYWIIYDFYSKFNLMIPLGLNNQDIFTLCSILHHSYNKIPFTNWRRAVDILQFMGFVLIQGNFVQIFKPFEISLIFISCLAAYSGDDGMTAEVRKAKNLPSTILFDNDILSSRLSRIISLFEQFPFRLFKCLSSGEQKFGWQIISSFVKVALDDNEAKNIIQTVMDLLEASTFDLKNENQKLLFATLLFIAAKESWLCRPIDICSEWSEMYTNQGFLLGDSEVSLHLTISHKCNRRADFVKWEKEIFRISHFTNNVMESLSNLTPDLSFVLENLQSNYNFMKSCLEND